MTEKNIVREFERKKDVSNMLVTAHSILGERYRRVSIVFDIVLMLTSFLILLLSVVDLTAPELLDRIDEVAFLSIRGAKSLAMKLRNHEPDARLARRLTEIATDAPIPEPEPSLVWRGPDLDELENLFDYLCFGQGLRGRCRRLAGD